MTELSISGLETLRSDGEFVLQRGRMGNDHVRVLVLEPVLEQPSECSRQRLAHEYALSGELGAGWAVRAVALGRWRGRTVLVLEDPGAEIVFTIRDQGIGIPEADREWLFNAFHRGHNVNDRLGTGLGLVIVKRCVDLHGGQIKVESEVGRGTVMTVSLPISDGVSS